MAAFFCCGWSLLSLLWLLSAWDIDLQLLQRCDPGYDDNMSFNVPMVLCSGFTWPTASMAPILKYLGYLFPATWLMHAARAITMKAGGWDIVGCDILILSIMALFFVSGAIFSTRRLRRKVSPETRTYQLLHPVPAAPLEQ